ncbi:MAG: elongation factor P [SAR116 cluster bacterium MED-G06]|jgi:elongation factor P|nr:MAG: elongation factor P [SAR116 cluster bacterium MED-G06]RPG88479.1 MAG: elongation factor P [Candidatus Puniceispirillum sp. TMED245]|tara:strand:+ start:429 stop:995 length:567 start_codon:yes stop_codon:yes gene_type:complete
MKLNGNAVKPGNVIEHNGRLWTAVKVEHVKPGKGGAFAQIELRDIRDGTKLNERFRSSETIERVILEESECTFLYDDGDNLVFMHSETFEQISINSDMVGDSAAFLQDSMVVTVSSHEGDPISVQLPDKVVMEIVEADAVVKGQTASSSYKPAVLENGVRVLVPPHIEAGTRIVVRPEDSTYVERAKD